MERPLTVGRDAAPVVQADLTATTIAIGGVCYPLVAGIPFVRPRPDLRSEVLRAVDAGDARAALKLLLADQDRFAPTPPPSGGALDRLLDDVTLNLREAMDLLSFGAVGDYFAHRWSSPTFASGLELLERARPRERPVVEVACGIGHFLRALERRGAATAGVDIVFAKLYLARRFLGVRGALVCGDVEGDLGVVTAALAVMGGEALDAGPTMAFCHDAFYFFEDKDAALANLAALASGGPVAVGHVHTAGDAHEAGFAEGLDAYAARLPSGAAVLDDHSLAAAFTGSATAPRAATAGSQAVAWVLDAGPDATPRRGAPPATLGLNPLLTAEGVAWPSESWRREYRDDARQLGPLSLEALAVTPVIREIVHAGPAGIAKLGAADREGLWRRRVLLDLPELW